jgi:hypothetical protein
MKLKCTMILSLLVMITPFKMAVPCYTHRSPCTNYCVSFWYFGKGVQVLGAHVTEEGTGTDREQFSKGKGVQVLGAHVAE